MKDVRRFSGVTASKSVMAVLKPSQRLMGGAGGLCIKDFYALFVVLAWTHPAGAASCGWVRFLIESPFKDVCLGRKREIEEQS